MIKYFILIIIARLVYYLLEQNVRKRRLRA